MKRRQPDEAVQPAPDEAAQPVADEAAQPARSGGRVYLLPRPPRPSPLAPEDFDRALRRMKNDLSLLALKRQILDPDLDAKTVLTLMDQIDGLQE